MTLTHDVSQASFVARPHKRKPTLAVESIAIHVWCLFSHLPNQLKCLIRIARPGCQKILKHGSANATSTHGPASHWPQLPGSSTKAPKDLWYLR